MDNFTKITKDALKYLAMMNVSCTPLCEPKKKKNQKYLVDLAKKGTDVSFKNFLKKLPEKSDLYGKIYQFAKESGQIHIGVTIVCRFFGGAKHIKKALEDVAGMKKAIKDFFIFIHVLIPFRVTRINGTKVSGIYENGDISVPIKNLMTFKMSRKHIEVGKIAFSHYASVICAPSGHFNDKFVEEILEEHAENQEFWLAAKSMEKAGGIDFNKMFELRKIAEEVAEKYDL